jgi:hypothetical protein
MLTAGPRDLFPRWRRSMSRLSVCSVLRCSDLWLQCSMSFVNGLKKDKILVWCDFLNHVRTQPSSAIVSTNFANKLRSFGRYSLLADSGHWVGLEWGSLSLVSTNEELLGRNSSGCCLEKRKYGREDQLRWPRDTFYPQKLVLTSPTSGDRSVDIVSSRSFCWLANGPCMSAFTVWGPLTNTSASCSLDFTC